MIKNRSKLLLIVDRTSKKYEEKQLLLKSITRAETLKLISPIVIVKRREEERKDLPGQITMKEQK